MLHSSSSEKKLVKPLKNVFGAQVAQKRSHYGPQPFWKTIFFAEITTVDHLLSETFYFIKISYVSTELWIFFCLEWCFLSKKCHFQLKQLYFLFSRFFCTQKFQCHATLPFTLHKVIVPINRSILLKSFKIWGCSENQYT